MYSAPPVSVPPMIAPRNRILCKIRPPDIHKANQYFRYDQSHSSCFPVHAAPTHKLLTTLKKPTIRLNEILPAIYQCCSPSQCFFHDRVPKSKSCSSRLRGKVCTFRFPVRGEPRMPMRQESRLTGRHRERSCCKSICNSRQQRCAEERPEPRACFDMRIRRRRRTMRPGQEWLDCAMSRNPDFSMGTSDGSHS